MTDKLTITLLGSPQIKLNGRFLQFGSVKAIALLAYLATSGRLHDRAELAALLWPESDNKRARGALRYTLSIIKKESGDAYLTIDRRQIGMATEGCWEADIFRMRQLLGTINENEIGNLEAGVALHQADFLHGFTLPDSRPFNDWATSQRETVRRELATALKRLTIHYQAAQQWETAVSYAHRWLDLDSLHEPAHCHLMQLYAASGEWAAVDNQYQALTDLLQAELGVAPQPETAVLYSQLCQTRQAALAATPDLASLTTDQRSRHVLIEKMRRFWVSGLLTPLRNDNRLITLKLQFAHNAIAHPWADVLNIQQQTKPANITHAFRQADRALLILGAPGAGKTISLVALADDLLAQARQDEQQPVPVILNLSGWAERQQPLGTWAVEEMVAKYQIPRRMGRAWLAQDRLLFLLDGLDEMPTEQRPACINAINTFRQENGLPDLIVCCRKEAYESAVLDPNHRLQLNGAVEIRPLTTAQIHQHAPAKLRDAIFADETLLEIAQSPLNLTMMQSTFADDGAAHGKTAVLTHTTLFTQYAQQMYQRQKEKGSLRYGFTELGQRLGWLAQQMQRHNQSIFLIEQLQPSWLIHEQVGKNGRSTTHPLQWLYLFLTRVLLAIFLGTPVVWSFIQLIGINPPFIEVRFFTQLAAAFGITQTPINTLLAAMLLNIGSGSTAALLDSFFFHWRQRRGDSAKIDQRVGVAQLLLVSGITGVAVMLIIAQTDPWPIALFFGGMQTLGVGLTFGYLANGQSFRTEVRVRGALKWSWRNAALWGAAGMIMSLLWSGIVWLNDPAAVAWQLNLLNNSLMLFLLGGVSGKQPSVQNRANEGTRIAAKNGALAFLFVALPIGVITAVTVNVASGFYTGLMIGIGAGTAYGFNDVAKHLIIRLLLWQTRVAPLQFAPLLDCATDCTLLQRVGGGYTFRHRLLQEHFATNGANHL